MQALPAVALAKAGAGGIEPPPRVLETLVIPLHYAPKAF
jgi:hypothetical protein